MTTPIEPEFTPTESETQLLSLPLFGDRDKPTWRGHINYVWRALDAAHGLLLGKIQNALVQAEAYTDSTAKKLEKEIADFEASTTKTVTDNFNLIRSNNVVNVGYYGKTKADIIRALDDAEARGSGTLVYFPRGVYDVGTGLSLAGRSVQIIGDGVTGTTSAFSGTVFYASQQSGPVLDFTGYKAPGFGNRVTFSCFGVQGSGVSDPTKKNTGISMTAMSGATFSNIAFRDTGGPCLDMLDGNGNSTYCNDFNHIIFNTPVNAAANDVPWFRAVEANGNRFSRFGFYSKLLSPNPSVGVSGAIQIMGGPKYSSHGNIFDSFWFENMRVVSGGSILNHGGINNTFTDWTFFDCNKENTDATNTAYMRFNPSVSTTGGVGGNIYRGTVIGNSGVVNTELDYGIELAQSYNSVTGVKGYKGNNVHLTTNTNYCNIELVGSIGLATNPGVVDDSGMTSNSWRDSVNAIDHMAKGWERDSSAYSTAPGPRFTATANKANGAISLGNLGWLLSVLGTASYLWSDTVYFRKVGDASAAKLYLGGTASSPSISTGTGAPSFVSVPGALYLQTDGGAGATLWIKETGTGTAGWVAK